MFFFWSSGSNPSTDSAIKKNDENPKDKIVKKREAVEASSQDLLINKSELKRVAKGPGPMEYQDEGLKKIKSPS